MEKNVLLAVLRLQKTKAIGDILAKKLITHLGSVEAIFEEKKSVLQKIPGVGTQIVQHLLDERYLRLAEKELEYISQHQITCSYFLDKTYPKNLQHCIDAPILVFQDGNIDLSNERIISIVGTRNMTSYGREFCVKLIETLQTYNPIIVSGFAYGVDICAHKAALANNLQTIAVLAHGLEQIYPKVHKKYMHQVHQNGGFLTEFWHNESPQRENFLKRNRIVAGISQATIVIESATKGGALVTADIANSYDRDVFALPGRVTDRYSQGCHRLIKTNQAHVLTDPEDIVQMLNWDLSKKKLPKQEVLFVNLDEKEQKVFDYLKDNGKQLLDLIALDCAIPTYQLSPLLLQMELKGVVKPLPGKMFEI